MTDSNNGSNHLLESVPDAVFALDREWRYTFVNESAARLAGMSASQMLGAKITDLVSGLEASPFFKAYERVMAGGAAETASGQLASADGRDEWHDIRVNPLPDGILCIASDGAARKAAEEALHRRAALLHSTIESLPFDFFAIDMDGRYFMQNSVCKEHWGDVTGKRPEDVAPSEATRDLWMKNNNRAFSGDVVSEEVTTKRGDVDLRLHNIVSPILHDGAVEGILGVNIDVTERMRATEALRRERDFANALLNAPQDTVFVFDPETRRAVRWNANFTAISEYTDEEISRMTAPDDFFGQEDLARAAKSISSTLESGQSTLEMSLVTKTGATIPFEYSASMVRDADGHALILAIGRDTSDRKHAEAERSELREQLLHTQKMDAIGTLAGGIAHDFNNLITGILGYSCVLQELGGLGSEGIKACEVIQKSAERAAELTQQLLGFARKGKFRDTPIDMHKTIKNVASILQHTIDKRIAITLGMRADTAVVNGDIGQLEQVMMNVALNARDAMPNGGELALETAVVELDEEHCCRHTEASPGTYLCVSISDSGTGIPDDVLPRIYDPFYTTKDVGKGTGMGLAMVYGIVKNHGGHITVDTEVGKGTTFKLCLPLEATRSPKVDSGEHKTIGKLSGRVMVVDDEEGVRSVTASILTLRGCEVVCMPDGKTAVDHYGAHIDDLDLVILDLGMPVMGGRECLSALKKLDPNVKVVITTGHSLGSTQQELLDAGALRFLRKPFTPTQLSEAVAEALEA